jgi:hypothetical protein
VIGLKDVQTPESEPGPSVPLSRLQSSLEPRGGWSPRDLERTTARFRVFLDDLRRAGGNPNQQEIDVLWFGYWRAYRDEKLEQRLEATRARLA